jgi:hypothetical protein
LCQFLFGTGLHTVYLFLPVLGLQGGKILRQPALCGKPLLGFRFRILPGLLGSICPADISFFWLLLPLSLPLPPLFSDNRRVCFRHFSTVCHKLPDHVS